jgi:hypothetical protein
MFLRPSPSVRAASTFLKHRRLWVFFAGALCLLIACVFMIPVEAFRADRPIQNSSRTSQLASIAIGTPGTIHSASQSILAPLEALSNAPPPDASFFINFDDVGPEVDVSHRYPHVVFSSSGPTAPTRGLSSQ